MSYGLPSNSGQKGGIVKEPKGNPLEYLYSRYSNMRKKGRFHYGKSREVVQAIREEIGMSRPMLAKLTGVSDQWLRVLETTDTPLSNKTIKAILAVYLRHAPGSEAERIGKANEYIETLWEIAVLAEARRTRDKVGTNFEGLCFR